MTLAASTWVLYGGHGITLVSGAPPHKPRRLREPPKHRRRALTLSLSLLARPC